MTSIHRTIHRPSTEIRREIESLDRDYARQRARLAREHDRARRLEAAEAHGQARLQRAIRVVLDRFDHGWWVAGINGMWWHRPGQVLVEPATPDDLNALHHLVEHGVMECGHKRRKVAA